MKCRYHPGQLELLPGPGLQLHLLPPLLLPELSLEHVRHLNLWLVTSTSLQQPLAASSGGQPRDPAPRQPETERGRGRVTTGKCPVLSPQARLALVRTLNRRSFEVG